MISFDFGQERIATRGDALRAAASIVGGASRHWNFAISNSDGGIERVQAIAASAQADAADVAMLCAIAPFLPDDPPVEGAER